MIEVLACIGFVAGIYSVWMSLSNKAEAQRMRELVWELGLHDKEARDKLRELATDIKIIGASSARLDGDMQKVKGDFALVSQYVKELELKTDRTDGQLKCFVSALTEGAKVTQKWFPENNP